MFSQKKYSDNFTFGFGFHAKTPFVSQTEYYNIDTTQSIPTDSRRPLYSLDSVIEHNPISFHAGVFYKYPISSKFILSTGLIYFVRKKYFVFYGDSLAIYHLYDIPKPLKTKEYNTFHCIEIPFYFGIELNNLQILIGTKNLLFKIEKGFSEYSNEQRAYRSDFEFRNLEVFPRILPTLKIKYKNQNISQSIISYYFAIDVRDYFTPHPL